jgi:predicted phage terminase large subunit-like protein
MLCEKLNDEINSIREKFEAESFHPLLKQLFEILLGRYHISPEYFVFSCQYELQKKFQEISFCETMWMDEKFQICGKSPQDFHIDGNSQLLRPNLNSHIFQLSCAELISISKLLKSYELLLHSNSSFCLSDVYQDLVGYTSQLLHNLFVLDDQLSLDIPPNPTNYSALFDEVESIKYEKYGEFYDLEVPNIHHYSAQGLFHHNSGKSSAGAQKALRKIMLGESGAVMNADFENLKTSTWAEFREWIPWDMVVPAHRYRKNIEFDPHQQFRLAFLNGATVVIKGVKDPSAARGANINWLWYDEAQRDDTGLSWQIAIASVRVGKDPQAWATFTPSSQGKDFWGYKFFVQQDISQEALELFEKDGGGRPLVEFFKGTIYDNQDNLDPGFMASLLALYAEGGLRQREVLGEFVGDESYLGDRRWFDNKVIYALPENLVKKVRYWDLAATEKKITGKKSNDPDESVGTRMSWNKLDFYIEDQVAGCWKWDDLKEKIYETAEKDGEYVQVFLEEEPGSGGKNQIAELTKFLRERLPNHSTAIGWRPPTDRLTCANTWFAEAKAGHVYLLYGDWNELFLNQFSCFPGCRHDDKITSVSGARYNLAPIKTWVTMKFLHL